MPAASSVDRVRRTLLFSAPALLLLGGCGATNTLDAHARALTERLVAVDHGGFLALFAAQGGSQALAERMFSTLSRAPAEFGVTDAGRLRVSWGFPGEPRVVSEASVTLSDGLIGNLVAATSGTEWLAAPMGLHASDTLVVATGTAQQLRRWSQAAEAALAALGRVVPDGQDWSRPVVVVVPEDLVGYAAYAGSAARTSAAVTVVPGTAQSAGVRVVVNPTVTQKTDDDRALIAHESVHAWMESPRLTSTPAWLIEGIAEAFTALAFPRVAATNRELARAAIADSGLPTTLPDVSQANPTSYALAQVAVQATADRVGWPVVLDEARARTTGTSKLAEGFLLGWYREALRRIG